MERNSGAIRIEDLCFSYTPKEPLIHGMGFHVGKGEIFGFLGPSGAGRAHCRRSSQGFSPAMGEGYRSTDPR